jgi:GAF domain-containing protein
MNDNENRERGQKLQQRLLEVLDEALRVDDAAAGKIRVLDPESGTLEIRAQRGFSERFVNSFRVIDSDDELPSARAFRLRHRVAIPDVAHDGQTKALQEAAREEGFRAMQATPIVDSRGRVIGTLSTHFPTVHRPSSVSALMLDHCAAKAAALLEGHLPRKR